MIVRKSLLCVSIYVLSSLHHFAANANHPTSDIAANTHTAAANSNQKTVQDLDTYIAGVYESIDFGKGEKLNPEVFHKAMHGYLNLKQAGKIRKDILSVVDFTLSSTENRLWIIDLKANKVLFNTYVAHGQGSGNEYATAFSNENNSHQSSLGFYVTGETYVGKHGNSLRLHGMDNGFNSAAYERAVVMHAADYVNKAFIASQNRLGRSWGCPAVSSQLAPAIINTVKNGSVLFHYYPQKQYLAKAYWLNKKVENVPAVPVQEQLRQPAVNPAQVAQALPVIRMDSVGADAAYRIPVSNTL